MFIRRLFQAAPAIILALSLAGLATADQPPGDPCAHLPNPPGHAYGIEKNCPSRGSSSGIAKGDFNGDGIADLAIGIPGKSVGYCLDRNCTTVAQAGAVQIIYGTAGSGLVASGGVLSGPRTRRG